MSAVCLVVALTASQCYRRHLCVSLDAILAQVICMLSTDSVSDTRSAAATQKDSPPAVFAAAATYRHPLILSSCHLL